MATTDASTPLAAPILPDGIVAIVKRACPTCELVAPVLEQLADTTELTVYTQDDPHFPTDADWVHHDHDLAVSWHHDIDTVPTLVKVRDGVEVERVVGWSRPEWEQFCGTDGLGTDLPEWRPGCGSLSVDPDLAGELAVRFSGSTLHARRVELASLEDEWEAMWDRGWSDGMPVVPPTEERVLRMLEGTTRDPGDIVTVVPPDLVECTVEKVAINAVMAGCKPEYLPVVLSAIEAACTPEFNMHGLLCTTMAVGPIMVVSGPITERIGMNHGINALGQGNRANATIGRALQLVVRNVGGGRPGEIDRATQGNPAKFGLCFAENEDSPWPTLAQSRGLGADTDALTLFAGEGPRTIVDQKSRTPESLVNHFAAAIRTVNSPKLAAIFDVLFVMSPEHMARFADAGWTRERFVAAVQEALVIDGDELIAGAGGIEEGMPDFLAGSPIPKLTPDGLLVAHAGGGAGLFSSIMAGWANGDTGSMPVTAEITP